MLAGCDPHARRTILTPLVDYVITSDPVQFPEGIAGLDKGYPRGRIGEPEDIANLCTVRVQKTSTARARRSLSLSLSLSL